MTDAPDNLEGVARQGAFAAVSIFNLTDAEKIALAVEIVLTVGAGGNGPTLRQAARKIEQHAHALGRGEVPRHSDGSVISSYGPGNGPMRAAFESKRAQVFSNIEGPDDGWVNIRCSETIYNLAIQEKLSLRGFMSAVITERREQQMRDIQNRPRRGESLPRRSDFEIKPVAPLANKFGRVVVAARIRHFGIKIKALIHNIINPAKLQGGRKNVR